MKDYTLISQYLKSENPYPTDLFKPISKEELKRLDRFLKREFNFSLTRLSGHIARLIREGIIKEVEDLEKERFF